MVYKETDGANLRYPMQFFMKTFIIIPARHGSTRLPAKPLAIIGGQTMIERVYRQCAKAEGIDGIYIATDHESIVQEVERIGAVPVMTSPECHSGTDRVAEAALKLGLNNDVIINVQGDEPLVDPPVITALAACMQEGPSVRVATPIVKITHKDDLTNPNVVKVVMTGAGDALYFSRQPIPYFRDLGSDHFFWLKKHTYFKHVGIYAYRSEVLREFIVLGESPLEHAERLEQLRLLEAGIPIRCVEVDYDSVAVDTPEDIDRVELRLAQSA
jgi:3-deoxy-manno-octulosonate cytidylyltransferase (CMP-KDO synthetase)